MEQMSHLGPTAVKRDTYQILIYLMHHQPILVIDIKALLCDFPTRALLPKSPTLALAIIVALEGTSPEPHKCLVNTLRMNNVFTQQNRKALLIRVWNILFFSYWIIHGTFSSRWDSLSQHWNIKMDDIFSHFTGQYCFQTGCHLGVRFFPKIH
jgi:hypothetical protein